MQVLDFLSLAMDDYYNINLFDTNLGMEVASQKTIKELQEDFQEYHYYNIDSWDIDEEKNFTLNISNY